MQTKTVGFALCGSFCTFKKVIPQMKKLVDNGYKVIPIMSPTAYSTDTRFGKAEDFNKEIEEICNAKIIYTISGAEPIGPKELLDALVIAPCTGNTLAKIANGINDTAVTMAVKAHVRNNKPVVIGISTNDGMGLNFKNLGLLFAAKNFYFVPFGQDDFAKKPKSLVADWAQLETTIEQAKNGVQIQPVLV